MTNTFYPPLSFVLNHQYIPPAITQRSVHSICHYSTINTFYLPLLNDQHTLSASTQTFYLITHILPASTQTFYLITLNYQRTLSASTYPNITKCLPVNNQLRNQLYIYIYISILNGDNSLYLSKQNNISPLMYACLCKITSSL